MDSAFNTTRRTYRCPVCGPRVIWEPFHSNLMSRCAECNSWMRRMLGAPAVIYNFDRP